MSDPERTPVGGRVNIYTRGKKKTYVADFWHDGKHCRASLSTANKKVAEGRAMELAVSLANGTYRQAPKPTSVRDAVVQYLDTLKTAGRSKKTLVKYAGVLDRLVNWLEEFKAGKISQFSPSVFDRYRAERRKKAARKTLYNEGVIIKQLFKWSKSRGLVAENSVADYKLEKPPLVPKPSPNLAEVDRILAALDEADRTLVALLAFTGMRSGELQRLQPKDVDLKGNWVHVVSREGLETKTRTSRKVPIHARLRAMLEALPATRKPWRFTMPPSRKYPSGDNRLNVKKLNERFQRAAGKVGLATGRDGGYTLHSLRHFFETHAVNAGVPQRVVDAWMGHASDKSMAAVYYSLRDEESQAKMAALSFGDAAENTNEDKK